MRVKGFREVMRVKTITLSVAALALWSPSCTTALLNSTTLDLAATVDDLAIRQILFNLAKTKENKWALPSQVQINGGQVTARTAVTPSVSTPLNSALTTTSQVASQVVGTALTTTTTNIDTKNRVNSGGALSGVIEDQQNWSVIPVQDPEQLRRLRLLYQYGAHQIPASDLLCLYPIPEIPEKPESKTDLQILAEALKPPASPKAAPSAETEKSGVRKLKKMYIRGEFQGSCTNISGHVEKSAKWTLVGENPDPAFLNPPGCVLCAAPNSAFQKRLKRGEEIYVRRTSDRIIPYDPDTYDAIPVIMNPVLIPEMDRDSTHRDFKDRQGLIDWLFVVKDGAGDPIRENSRRVGSSNGYTIYTTDDQRFSEFILAVTEATLQTPQLQKGGPPPPTIVQTAPSLR